MQFLYITEKRKIELPYKSQNEADQIGEVSNLSDKSKDERLRDTRRISLHLTLSSRQEKFALLHTG